MVVNYKVAAVTAGLAGALTLTGFAAPALAETADATPQAEQTDGKEILYQSDSESVYKTADGLLVGESDEGTVVVDSQGLLYTIFDDELTMWNGYYIDDSKVEYPEAGYYLEGEALSTFDNAAKAITPSTSITIPNTIAGVPVTYIYMTLDEDDDATASAACTSIDISALQLESVDASITNLEPIFYHFTSLQSIKMPLTLPDHVDQPYFDAGCAPSDITFVSATLPRLSSNDIILKEGGSIHVPAGLEQEYFNLLLGRDVNTGFPYPDRDAPMKILSEGQLRKPKTKQEVFGAATESNPIVADDNGFAFLKSGDGTLAFIGFNSLETAVDESANVSIPSAVNGAPVTSIARCAFLGSPYLQSGRSCSVKSIEIPESVASIQEDAFAGVRCADELVIPQSVTQIEEYAFSKLKTPKLTILAPTAIKNGTFYGAHVDAVSLPNVTEIQSNAMNSVFGVKSLEINPSIDPEKIADDFFDNNTGNLTYVSGPESLVAKFEKTVEQNVQNANSGKTAYTVKIHGVDGSVSTQAVVEGEKIANVPAEPSVPGFTFKGWVTKDGETFDPAEDVVSKGLELSASFKLDAPKVTLTASSDKPTEGDVVTLTAKAEHEAEGTTFTYQWYCDGNKVPGATDPTLNATGSGDYEVKVVATNGGRTATARTGIELAYAPKPEEPKPLAHRVTVVFGNGSNDMVLTVNDGDKITGIEAPEREGYEFAGWFLTVDEDGKLSDEYDFSKPVTGDFTLYAGWVKKGSQGEKPEGGSEQKPEEKPADKPTGGALPKTGDASLLPAAAASLSGLAALAGAYLTRRRK